MQAILPKPLNMSTVRSWETKKPQLSRLYVPKPIPSERVRPLKIAFLKKDDAKKFLSKTTILNTKFEGLGFREEFPLDKRTRWRALLQELEKRRARGETGLCLKNGVIHRRYLWRHPLIIKAIQTT